MTPAPDVSRWTVRVLAIVCLVGLAPCSFTFAQFGGGNAAPQYGGDTAAPQFRSYAQYQATPLAPPKTSSPEYQQIDAIEKRVQGARLSLQVVDMPLDQVVRIVTQRTGIPMRIDERALEDVGLSADVPITFKLPEVAAETLLYLMLKQLDLVYTMDTGSVVITTPEVEESNLRTEFYPVEDIFNDPNPNYDILLDMITTCIEPESWEELGGPASIVAFRNGVIVAQTYQNHRRLQGLFEALRRVQQSKRQDDLPVMLSVSPYASQAEQIERQLRQVKTTITLTNAPLGKAVAAISNFGRIPMIIDNRALEDVGLSTDVPISIQLTDTSLDYMLDVIGEKLDLTTIIYGEVLIVTTPEEAESELATLLFPVKDLVRYDPTTGKQFSKQVVWAEFDQLIEAITTTVESESWEELGGPGSIAPFPYNDCLVIAQLDDVHRKVAELLEQVRTAKPKVNPIEPATSIQPSMPVQRSSPSPAAPEAGNGERIIVVSYEPEKSLAGEFTREDFARIAERLKQVVAPQSWSDEQYFADATHSGVFVRQSRAVQRTVSSYLANQGLIAPPIEEDLPVATSPAQEPPPEPVPAPAPSAEIPATSESPPAFDSSGGGGGIF
ncbi:hypothetical protein [Bremerella sp.]|uniref:hypothetical protein n=1 Tax=Bremerella sp. TaxID=2795602 RepID=UPI00391BD15A